MFSLGNLETLELRENLLKYLPSSLARLSKLRILDLGDNMLEELVREFWLYILPISEHM